MTDRRIYMSFLAVLLFAGTMALSLWATMRVRQVYSKFSILPASSGSTGANTAVRILSQEGIYDVEIVEHDEALGDHYDPTRKRLVLSRDNFHGTSAAALGVAAHECGLRAAAWTYVAAFITSLGYFLLHLLPLIVGRRESPIYDVQNTTNRNRHL